MELLIQVGALLLTLILTVVKSMDFTPSPHSDFELNRLENQGLAEAKHERQRRDLLTLFTGSKSLKEILLTVFLVGLLMSTLEPWLGMILSLVYLAIAQVAASKGWLNKVAWQLQQPIEPFIAKRSKSVGLLKLFAPQAKGLNGAKIGSREELLQMVSNDQHLLDQSERDRLLAALDFDSIQIKQAMVGRDQIATVDITETVGPLLLDKLHKDGHNVFVVVKKDLDHIKGLLYMRDLVPLDPDLKEVRDAVRPTVHYLPQTAKIQSVVAAGLQTGRQLFIVVDDKGKTVGLITLRDALAKLLGQAPKQEFTVATDPKKV